MIQEKQKISGTLNSKQSLNGSLSNSVIYVDPITQEKTVIPSVEQQIVTPDENYTGLSKVTVEAIQDSNLIPENIKNGVDILGITGNYVGSKYAPRYISFYNYTGTELDEELANLDTCNLTNMSNMFYSCTRLTDLDLSSFITSEVTNMSNMFNACNKLTSLNISSFNTSNVTNMASMFNGCNSLSNLDLTSFDTSKVTNMGYIFSGCQKLTDLDLSGFDTSKVIDINSMFYSCRELATLDLSGFDTSKVTNISYMFYNCQKLATLDLSNFNTSNVTSISYMFNSCYLLGNIPKLNASKVNYVTSFAYNCKSLTDFGGLENLGQAYSTTTSANSSSYKLDLSTCTALTEQSLINVLTNLYDIATKGCKTQQVVLGSTNLAKLTSEEGQSALSSATEKGWSIS